MTPSTKATPREIVKRISDAAIELAFTRHELTTTDFEATEYADIEEGVEAFKELVEDVKTDVFACLTGDEEGCLDPEDVDPDNELRWLERVTAHDTLLAENQRLRELLRSFLQSPIEYEDPRISYAVMQIEKRDLEDAATALKEGE